MNESNSNREKMFDQEMSGKSWLKRLGQFLQSYQWLIWIVGVLGVFFLGSWGFKYSFPDVPIWSVLYRVLQLFVLNMDSSIPNPTWQLEIARWLAAIIFGYTAVKALSVLLRQQLQLLKIRLRFKDHIIIAGLGNKGFLLALKLKHYGYKVVAIEPDEENDNIKECRDNGIIVLIGNATSADYLYKAGLKRAKYLFSVCGQDDINAEIAVQVHYLISNKKRKPLTCIVHIMDPHFYHFLKEQEFGLERMDGFRIEFLNLFDRAAQAIMEDQRLSPFEKKETRTSSLHHLLVVGVGHMGESLIIHAAKKWMGLSNKTDEKLIITIVDQQANKIKDMLYLRYPGLDKVCLIIAQEIDIKSKDFENGRFLFSEDGSCNLDIIYVCLDNNSFAIATALNLYNKLRKYDTPIVVQMNRETGLIKLLENQPNTFNRISGFGLLDRVLKPELMDIFTHEMLARNIHDEYVKERLSEGETERINPFLISWDNLPDHIKESNRRQADNIGYKLHAIGCYIIPKYNWNTAPVEFTPGEIEMMAKIEHNLWMEERLKDGWKFAQGLKNTRKKTSPFLIPWTQLPEEEKEKDRDTVRKIPAYLSKAGFQIYRSEKKPDSSSR
ncbi:MAG TPA: RyR domain-containing protein [Candidatus Kapabacteria bacterium]|nr:RyR domain-containing protein [Candidatus Kapabacteria bacterium]